jgi:hypothetical protein
MKRSWLIHGLILSSAAAGALLVFTFLNDLYNLTSGPRLVPVTFTGTLWNIVGLPPSPASLIGLIPYFFTDPLLTPHYRPFLFFSVLLVTAALCFVQTYGLRRNASWALYSIFLFCLIDFGGQAVHLARTTVSQWPASAAAPTAFAGFAAFLLASKRMILKVCLDTGCAAALSRGGYGDFSLMGEEQTRAPWPRQPAAPLSNSLADHRPPVLGVPGGSAGELDDQPQLRKSARVVLWGSVACCSVLLLLVVSKPLFPTPSPSQFDLYARLMPSFLVAALQYGMVAWQVRRGPDSFGLGLACACSFGVSAAGFVTGPILFLGLFQRSMPAFADTMPSLKPVALLVLAFIVANFGILFSSLRISWLTRFDTNRSPASWALGFAFPFVLLIVLRAMVFHWLP